MNFRVGIGHDTHRLGPGGPTIRLGGIDIEFDSHLVGHSDADVLLHAVTDAILGACKLGDIGDLFPNTAAENKQRDSSEFLKAAVAKAHQAGYRLVNLDCIVFAEKPKLSPYKERIAHRIGEIIGASVDCISVKAKTGETVGPVGRQEAIVAECVALMKKTNL